MNDFKLDKVDYEFGLWPKLEERLRAVANNKANGGCDGTALICINLIRKHDGNLIGWYKPQRISLEPKSFDVSALIAGQRRLGSRKGLQAWEEAMGCIHAKFTYGAIKDNTLVILNGQPVGFL